MISQNLIDKVTNILKPDGIRYFKHLKGLTGRIDPILKLNLKRKGRSIHSVNFVEGRQIIDFLMTCEECSSWSESDYNSNWKTIVETILAND